MNTFEIISLVGGAVVTIITGTWVLLQFIFKMGETKKHLEDFEVSTNKNFDKIDKRFEKIDNRFEKIEGTLEEHTIALTQVYAFLGQKYPKRGAMFLQKASPRKLTDLGVRIYNEVDGEKFIETNKDILFEYIDKEEPKTKLDIEMQSYQALMALSNDDSFNGIKDYLYEAPAIDAPDGSKYELTIGDICLILSVPLRDLYIKEHNIQ